MTDFGSSNAIICGIVYSEGWRGTSVAFSAVKKYYSDEFSGRNWEGPSYPYNDGSAIIFIVDASTQVEITDFSPDTHERLPLEVRDAAKNYQNVYDVSVSRTQTNDCP